MGLRINTNVTSIAAQRTLGVSSRAKSASLEKLSSGSRINKAADDAAGLAISEKFRAQIRGVKQAERNANDGISMIQTAEGAMNEISSMLVRLRELSVQAASDTIGDVERGFSDLEYQNLKQEIQRITEVTEFNGKKLMDGSEDVYDFQIGINNNQFQDRIRYRANQTNTSLESMKLVPLNVTNKVDARESLIVLDKAIEQLSGQRAELGAVQNRLTSTIMNLQISSENLAASKSRIKDTDFAEEAAKNVQLSILNQSGAAVLAQANAKGQLALKLLS